MKNKELFDRTIGILVKAYMEDTLQHQNCFACAVGNLIAANNDLKYSKRGCFLYFDGIDPQDYWGFIKKEICKSRNEELGKKLIENTGYSGFELNLIEVAFEKSYDSDDSMLNGLMAVCDTLMQIHEATTEEITEAKTLFVKA